MCMCICCRRKIFILIFILLLNRYLLFASVTSLLAWHAYTHICFTAKNKNTFGCVYNNNNNNSICFVYLLLPQLREFVTRKMRLRSSEGYFLLFITATFLVLVSHSNSFMSMANFSSSKRERVTMREFSINRIQWHSWDIQTTQFCILSGL